MMKDRSNDDRLPRSHAHALHLWWDPALPVMLHDADKNEYQFPFLGVWLAEKIKEDDTITGRSFLNRKQCRELWRWLERTDPPPTKLWIFVNRAKFEAIFPEVKHERKRNR